jgi:N-acetyl-beta-hexosaminidase
MLTTLLVVAAAAGARAVPSPDVALHSLVWPPPRSMSVAGEKLPVAPEFSITTTHRGSATLDGAIARFSGLAAKTAATGDASSAGALRELKVTVASADESLGIETDYSYRLTIANGSATASAQTVFGAMYALESFTQLLDEQTGAVLHSSVSIDDVSRSAVCGLARLCQRAQWPPAAVLCTGTRVPVARPND